MLCTLCFCICICFLGLFFFFFTCCWCQNLPCASPLPHLVPILAYHIFYVCTVSLLSNWPLQVSEAVSGPSLVFSYVLSEAEEQGVVEPCFLNVSNYSKEYSEQWLSQCYNATCNFGDTLGFIKYMSKTNLKLYTFKQFNVPWQKKIFCCHDLNTVFHFQMSRKL